MTVLLACRYQCATKPERTSRVRSKHREKDLGFI